MPAYYNEHDPKAAAWLRELIADDHIAAGDVDERSIADVQPSDISSYTQVHFFAGIGGWSYAARLAGWPDDRPLWTGSCPCQPFSGAGKRQGTSDPRHLWPEFARLIRERRPATIFGEQVASQDGRLWLAGIRTDLEELGYGVGAADLCAAGVGAPHIRQRLWWVADRGDERLADAECLGREVALQQQRNGRETSGVGQTDECRSGSPSGGLGDSDIPRSQERRGRSYEQPVPQGRQATEQSSGLSGMDGGTGNAWATYDIVHCTDGKARRFESFAQSLVDGLPSSLGPVRADAIHEIETEIDRYAAQANRSGRQVVRDLWDSLHTAAAGERPLVLGEAILLVVLHQLADTWWRLAESLPRSRAEIPRPLLRMLWCDATSPCPPHRRELAEQYTAQSANPVHPLSLFLARAAYPTWVEACARHAAATFPLAVGVPGRVGLLRGYGNAIVPAVAAEFIRAYLDVIEERR